MNDTDGIINLAKPTGITSAKAVYRVRSITGVRKSGHAGTLDPAAEGVLVVCQGRATKLVEQIMDLPKVYLATARLDLTSKSFDSDGPTQDVSVSSRPTADQVRSTLARFEGEIQQVPPQVSAIKINGVPAYKMAGRPDAPPMRSRAVRIHWTHLRAYAWPTIEFEVACGRGMYVRALIRDLGLRLETGGCLTSLRRTAVGGFCFSDAWSFERLLSANGDEPFLISLDEAKRIVSRPEDVPPRPDG